jgi:hypothetical protein
MPCKETHSTPEPPIVTPGLEQRPAHFPSLVQVCFVTHEALMQSQSAGLPLCGSEPSSCGGDGDEFEPYTILQRSVLPDAINLGRQKDSAQNRMTPHQLRELALKLQDNPHITALDLSNQWI